MARMLALTCGLLVLLYSQAALPDGDTGSTGSDQSCPNGTCSDCDPCGESGCGCGGGGIVFQAEALFFKYFRADGMRAGNYDNVPAVSTDDIEFQYSITPRLTLGYVFDNGLGIRTRWWQYDQDGDAIFPDTLVAMGVDAQTVDLELFEVFDLNDRWSVEIAGGIRYNDFKEWMIDSIPDATRSNSFSGFGGEISLEARRSLGRWGGLYLRGREAILQGDKTVLNYRPATTDQNAILRDSTLSMTEIAMGYEYTRQLRRAVVTVRTGYEWQNWSNFSSAFTPVTTAPTNPGANFAGASDVGFSGFTASLGIEL